MFVNSRSWESDAVGISYNMPKLIKTLGTYIINLGRERITYPPLVQSKSTLILHNFH